jgi:assimilatory nitrate reductase catalytic subunit
MPDTIKTTCPYCGVGCGLEVARSATGAVEITGDPGHPSNSGRLCSKGAALGETIDPEGRLLQPRVDGAPSDWSTALDRVATGFADVIEEHGPDAVAFYVSGQLLTEDYYVANKLMKGFIGSANIDTNSRLCMSSAVVAHKRAFGSDTVPGNYEDFETADLVVLAGSNTAWCHPVLYQRIAAARQARPEMRVVVIDPRRTATCDIADLHLAVAPGSDATLFNGLLTYLAGQGLTDKKFVAENTVGLSEALAVAKAGASTAADVARRCGLPEADVAGFFGMFAATPKTVTLFSQGVNQSTGGSDKGNAIINCHLLTGRIGRPGTGPFSMTGQPNAMGGREVGGLANQLAAHMDIENAGHRDRVQRFWQAPAVADKPGLKAVDLFEAVGDGRIKAIWIMATNPVVSMPDADRVRAALKACDLVVVSDVMADTDTVALADVVLPALAWGEKDGTVTNSERRISRQRAFLPPPGVARSDWWAVCEVARRLGHGAAFDYETAVEIFREHAALSGFENNGTRDFDISALTDISPAAYDALAPVQWPLTSDKPEGRARLFEDGRFFHADGKARFISAAPKPLANETDPTWPLSLNTGRVRDHWHTMTRTGKSARLSSHIIEAQLEIHPADAAACAVGHGGLADVTSRWGQVTVRVHVTTDQRPGSVFVPMHWNEQFASLGRIGAVVNPDTDPLSGQPEFKHTPVQVTPRLFNWHAFVLSRRPLQIKGAGYVVCAPGQGFYRYELAGDVEPASWSAWSHTLFGDKNEAADRIEYSDTATGHYRCASLRDNVLEACLFVSSDHLQTPRAWLASLFAEETVSHTARASLMAGQPGKGVLDNGPVVCACFGVGLNSIAAAIASQGLTTVDEIGTALRAGTNCGSCKPELSRLLKDVQVLPAA